MEKLEPGLHSTKGIGKTEPDPAGNKELDGCKVILTNLLITRVGHPSKWLQQLKHCRCLLELVWRTAAGRLICCTMSTLSMMSPRYSSFLHERHLVQANCPTPHSYFRNLHLGSPLNLCLIWFFVNLSIIVLMWWCPQILGNVQQISLIPQNVSLTKGFILLVSLSPHDKIEWKS